MTVTLSSPYRSLGDAPVGVWERVLSPLSSPMLLSLEAIVKAASPHGALCLVQAIKESTAGRDDTAKQALNAWGLMVRPGSPAPYVLTKYGYRLQVFPSWAAGAREFSARLNAEPYVQVTTLGEYIDLYFLGWLPGKPHTYPPGNTPADRDLYRSQTVERLNSYVAGGGTPVPTMVQIAGIAKPVALGVPFRQSLIPKGQTNNRPGIPMVPKSYTQHETGNERAGTNAEMHRKWLLQGAPGAAETQVCVHFFVDDHEAIQMLPVNEVAWHAGDSDGPGNMSSIACELCVNSDSNKAKARDNAAKLAAAVMTGIGSNIIWQHNHWSGKDCPAVIRRDGAWPTYTAAVSRYMTSVGPPQPPEPPIVPAFPWLTHTLLGEMWGTRTDAVYSPTGALSTTWRERGLATGQFPELAWYGAIGGGKIFRFLDGWTAWASPGKGVVLVKG